MENRRVEKFETTAMQSKPLNNSGLIFLLLAAFLPTSLYAQDRLKAMPGYAQFQKLSREMTNAVKLGSIAVTWKDDGQALEFQQEGLRYRYDIATRTMTNIGKASVSAPRGGRRGAPGGGRGRAGVPERGRQFTSALSPDGKFKAFYRDRNLWLSDANGANEIALTKDGSDKTRVKYGTANWVYGEELYQNTAMWWSSNSAKIAFYRFDESQVKDFYLQMNPGCKAPWTSNPI